MLRAILNKSWRQHPTRHQLYGHLPPITKTIQIRQTRHAGHCWTSRDELISDVLLWIPTYRRAKAGRPARTSIQQLCEDTGCSPEDLPEAMNDREKWRERVMDIRDTSTTWWWWWWWWWLSALNLTLYHILSEMKRYWLNTKTSLYHRGLECSYCILCRRSQCPNSSHTKRCLRDDIKLHLILRLQFWRSGKCLVWLGWIGLGL